MLENPNIVYLAIPVRNTIEKSKIENPTYTSCRISTNNGGKNSKYLQKFSLTNQLST
jgi:hypothetical protein